MNKEIEWDLIEFNGIFMGEIVSIWFTSSQMLGYNDNVGGLSNKKLRAKMGM